MSNPNVKPSHEAVLAAVINPQSLAPGAASSGWVSMGPDGYEAIQAAVLAGALGTGATLDGKLEQATSAAGAGAKDIAGKAITQLTKAGSDDNKQAIINCRSDELDANNGYCYVRLTITVGGAASQVAGTIHGHYARYAPHAAATSVDEVVG